MAVQGTSAKITKNQFEAENEKFRILCFFVFLLPTKILLKTFHFFTFSYTSTPLWLGGAAPKPLAFLKVFISDF